MPHLDASVIACFAASTANAILRSRNETSVKLSLTSPAIRVGRAAGSKRDIRPTPETPANRLSGTHQRSSRLGRRSHACNTDSVFQNNSQWLVATSRPGLNLVVNVFRILESAKLRNNRQRCRPQATYDFHADVLDQGMSRLGEGLSSKGSWARIQYRMHATDLVLCSPLRQWV